MNLKKERKKIDVVIPLLNEEGIVDELVSRLKKATENLAYNFEFILVDDGSNDSTLTKLISQQSADKRIKLIRLSRNWGQQCAYNAGLDEVSGDAAILMDGDLEDPPELIAQMIQKWEEGYEVVYTVKKSRKRNFLYTLMFKIFYVLLTFTSGIKIDQNSGMFSLLGAKALSQLKKCKEKNKYYVGLRYLVGFKQTKISYHRSKRFHGKPKQSFKRLFNYALNAFFSFSFFPIRILTFFGFLLLVNLTLFSIILVFANLTNTELWILGPLRDVPGWTSIIIAILFVLAMQTIFIGVLGEYIARIYDEVRNRPYYVVEDVYESVYQSKDGEPASKI